MSQIDTDAPLGKDANDHANFHNELARLHNQLDDDAATNGDVLRMSGGNWVADTPANHGLSTDGHTHTVSELTDLDLGAAKVVSGTYAPVAGDTVLVVNTSGGAATINLPAVDSFDDQALLIIQYGTNSVTINRNGTDEIWTDGSTTTSKVLSATGSRWSGVAVSSLDRWITIS